MRAPLLPPPPPHPLPTPHPRYHHETRFVASMRHVATSPIYVDAQTSPIPDYDAEAVIPGPEDLLMGDFFSSESGEPTGENTSRISVRGCVRTRLENAYCRVFNSYVMDGRTDGHTLL